MIAHIAFGVAVVAPAALHIGFRAWGTNEGQRPLQRIGLALAAVVALQVVLGLGAFLTTHGAAAAGIGEAAGVLLATAHQACGAILLGLAVLLACWSFRLLSTGRPGRPKSPPDRSCPA